MTDADDPDQQAQFDAEPILAVLERHGVEYVIVGGYAARMHGSARPTRDIDVTPATTVENLDRLSAALRELDARIRTDAVSEGLPFAASGESLVGQRMLNLQTRHAMSSPGLGAVAPPRPAIRGSPQGSRVKSAGPHLRYSHALPQTRRSVVLRLAP